MKALFDAPCSALSDVEVEAAYGVSSPPPQSVVNLPTVSGQANNCRWTVHDGLFLEVQVTDVGVDGAKIERDQFAKVYPPTGVVPDSFKHTGYLGRPNAPISIWLVVRGPYELKLDGCSNFVSDADMPICDNAAAQLGSLLFKRVAGDG